MAKTEPIRVVVELEAASEPIRGSVRTESGERSFDGWMQLSAALEDARVAKRRLPPDGGSAALATEED